MTDEFKKKMEELVEKSWKARVKKSLGTNTVFVAMNDDYSNGFKDGFEDGFQAAHDMMKKDYDAKVQKLVEALRFYADEQNWGEFGDMREWYKIESKDRGELARQKLAEFKIINY